MTPDIQELKAKAEAATTGEWLIDDDGNIAVCHSYIEDGYTHTETSYVAHAENYQHAFWIEWPDKANADYIAAASPSTILALIEIAEAAEEVAARLETRGFPVSDAARPSLIRDGARETVALDEAAIRLRTALEGVKKQHASDCATNNMPAMPAGKCDCKE